MKSPALYLLEVFFCSGMLLAFYRLLLVRKVSFAACRRYLVAAMLLSAAIPALDIPLYPARTEADPLPLVASQAVPPAEEPFVAEAGQPAAVVRTTAPATDWGRVARIAVAALYLLTAGELLGLALGKFLHMDHFQRFPDASGDFRFCRTVLFQAVSYVLLYRHVRKQSIALKYHADIPLIYRDLSHRLTVKQHVAVFRMLESRDHSQSRRLSAAGRTENRYESSVFYFQIDMIYHRILTVDFREIF